MSTLAPRLLTARFERQIVKVFRSQRAVSGPAALRLRDLGLKDSEVLRHLVATTIVRKAGPERYFLHEPTWAARGHMSWRAVGVMALGTALAFLSAIAYLVTR